MLVCTLTARIHRDVDGGAHIEHSEVLPLVDDVYFCSTHVEHVFCTEEHPEPYHRDIVSCGTYLLFTARSHAPCIVDYAGVIFVNMRISYLLQ